MNDQIYIIQNPIGARMQQPMAYSLVLAGCVYAGNVLFGSANARIALYVVGQMTVCSAVVTYCAVWIWCRGGGLQS